MNRRKIIAVLLISLQLFSGQVAQAGETVQPELTTGVEQNTLSEQSETAEQILPEEASYDETEDAAEESVDDAIDDVREDIDVLGAPSRSDVITVEYRTQKDIIDYVKASGVNLNDPLTFKTNPVLSAPYSPGALSDSTLNSALKMLNVLRYIAGVPNNVTLSEDYNQRCQAGAIVNYGNGMISHYPAWPSGMSADLYNLGVSGCSSSNIAWASWQNRSINETIVFNWMNDGDYSNIDRVGHRRWLLNPSMGQTGFGAVSGPKGTFSQVYVFDHSNSEADMTGMMWPAQNMPIEYIYSGFPWSISIGRILDANAVTVDLIRENDKKHWYFSAGGSNGYFNVDNGGYGLPGCIIFRPDGVNSYNSGDSYHVIIHGVTSDVIEYTVNFFSLSDVVQQEKVEPVRIKLSDSYLRFFDDESAVLTATVEPSSSYDKRVTWTSSNPGVATVNNGVVKGVSAGETVITAQAVNGVKATCNVTVVKKIWPEEVTLNQQSQSLLKGENSWLYATVTPANAYDRSVTWSSSNPAVVMVDNGTLTATSPGNAVITAKTVNGLTAKCEIGVVLDYNTDNPFGDVSLTTGWEYPYVKYAYDNEFMTGKGEIIPGKIRFDPSGALTRAEFVQIIYAMEGRPEVTYSDRFSDVPEDMWYTDAVIWASDQGIVAGKGDAFDVWGIASRQELATIFRKYAEYKGFDVSGQAELESYADVDQISSWAVENMRWAIDAGIMVGKNENLDPRGMARRAECAAMLKSFHEKINEE